MGDAIEVREVTPQGYGLAVRLPTPEQLERRRTTASANIAIKEPKVNTNKEGATSAQSNQQRLYESFRRTGMTEGQALAAAAGREGYASEIVTEAAARAQEGALSATERRMVESFKLMGLSDDAAIIAARGR